MIKHPLDLHVEITDTEALKQFPRQVLVDFIEAAGFEVVPVQKSDNQYWKREQDVIMLPPPESYLYPDCVAVTIKVLGRVKGTSPLRVWKELYNG